MKMSLTKGVISSSQQLVYLTQWFAEFSEMQKLDFMNNLIKKYSINKQNDELLINGFTQMGVGDRPASIFQCRMKLFTEWFMQWSDEEKHELLSRLRNIDEQFMDEFRASIETTVNHNNHNTNDNETEVNEDFNKDNVEESAGDHNKVIDVNIDDESKENNKPLEVEEELQLESKDQIEENIVTEDETPLVVEVNGDQSCQDLEYEEIKDKIEEQVILNGNSEELSN